MSKTIIIGGGLLGVSTLYELARRGVPALLLEAHDDLAAEASFANGGMLTASMSDPWNAPGVAGHLLRSFLDPASAMKLRLRAVPGLIGWGLEFLRNATPGRHKATTRANFALADYSVRRTGEVIAAESLACDGAPVGVLKVFASEAALEAQRRLAELLAPEGLRHEVLDPDGVVGKEPELRAAKDGIACGIYYPDDASGDARAFTQGLAARAEALGGEIRTGVAADRILTGRGAIAGVAVGEDVIAAEQVVVAAGCGSPTLTRPLGVRLPIKPAKGYSVTVDIRGWNARPRLPVVDDAMHAAVVPLGDRLRMVGTAEFTGFDRRLTRTRIDTLFDLADRLYPHLAPQIDRAAARAWAGFRPMSADGRPFIGRAGPEGLWVNTGHSHLGWTMAMGSASLLAALMLGEAPAVDPEPFRADR